MINILICGDYCPRDRVADLIESENYKAVFGEIVNYTSQADYSIVNLEAPVVESEALPIAKCGPNLKCSSKAVKAIRYAGFDMVTLANNHFYDYGDRGVEDTLKACKEQGVEFVGGGVNAMEASAVLYKEINGIKIAIINCCEHEFSIATESSGGANPLNAIRQYYDIQEAKRKADRVIVIVHGGHEHYNLPSPRMKETYRFFIDAGADVVVNHHQHCYSGYEEYKGRPIFYGLGNFCFDWRTQRNSFWNTGYMVSLKIDSDMYYELIPYVQGSDDYPGVHILSDTERKGFDNQIKDLNKFISNDNQLRTERERFMEQTKDIYLLSLEPYQNRYIRALYTRKLLPSSISAERRLQLLNYLQCESHIERLLYSLQNNKKNDC